ncbi:MAG: serine/threonine protein kinase [Labilithrix sp.]|nr:serine/threonine protein kinase [Labilithrix sp.]
MNIDVGQVIAGKYELVKLLGKGAMGEVWLANHNSLGGQFAIKLVEPTDDIEAETAAGRFQLEAQIAAKLSRRTRHIVSVSDHGEEKGLAYLVMELLEGESLEARTKRVGALALPEVAAIVSQVARALSLAHEEGIFHRDLKPANVWLGRDEDGRLLAKLLDFGIARSAKPFRTRSPFATSKDMVLGTPSYMSPEQARGLDTLDHRCDLWALGVVAYEALTTRIPFEGETVEDIFLSICTFRVVPALARRADLPPEIEGFFARAFAPSLEERFASAAELTEAFERLVTPEDLELALGIPLTPTSARRLEVARGSSPRLGSHPDLGGHARPGSHPDLGGHVGPGSHPDLGGHVGPGSHPDLGGGSTSEPRMASRGSAPDFENVALGEPTYITRRSGTTGWLIAIAGLIALLGIGVLVLVSFRGSSRTVGSQPAEPATTAVSSAPPPAVVASEAAPLEVAPPDDPAPVADAPPPSTPATAARPRTTAAKTAATASPPATAAPHPPPPPPPPAKSVNKAEVF